MSDRDKPQDPLMSGLYDPDGASDDGAAEPVVEEAPDPEAAPDAEE